MSRATPRQHALETEPRVRRGYFECRYGQLHVHNAIPPGGGFEEGTPLVCVHGAGGSGRVFTGFLALIGRDRSVYAPDLPGCGESDAPARALAAAEYAAAIGDFLDSMRLRHVDVLGYAAGAAFATELALGRATQVRRLVLASVPLAAGNSPRAGHGAGLTLDAAAAQYPLRERLGRVSQPLLVLPPATSGGRPARGCGRHSPPPASWTCPNRGQTCSSPRRDG